MILISLITIYVQQGLLKNVKSESKNLVKPFEPITFLGFKCGDFGNVVE